jgi:hypothetical protein
MAKNPTTARSHRAGTARDRQEGQRQSTSNWVKRDAGAGRSLDRKKNDGEPLKGNHREILFPTEPSTVGRKKIDQAIEQVISRKKQ